MPDNDAALTDDDLHERARRFAMLLTELVLIAVVVRMFHVEDSRHFFPVLCVAIGGFAIHTWLPAARRLPFFALLSTGTVLFVLGLRNGLYVLGAGGALIGISCLPIRIAYRAGLLVAVGIVLIFCRSRYPMPFWPVLGSMFMFRLLLFVYERRHEPRPPSLALTASYFFLLPNVCFPLFPVIDFRTFRDTRYDTQEWQIYQRGVAWIVRGLIHLLLYRLVKSHLVPEPWELHDVRRVAVFMATNYALYLQVSGQFHVITGMLHLFGFHLPRTHDLFFLASSFSDIWRRINIYWKDFMAKIFFFPAFFAARRRNASAEAATVAAILVVFVATWLLHSWQTFWLLGRFPLTANDGFLWLGAGVCVALNAWWDTRRGVQRQRSAVLGALSMGVRTVCMFALVSLFWACWTSPGFLAVLQDAVGRPEASLGLVTVLLWLLAGAGILTAATLLWNRRASLGIVVPSPGFGDSVKLHVAGLTVVLMIGSPWFGQLLKPQTALAMTAFRTNADATASAEAGLVGYYEDLNRAEIQSGPLIRSFAPDLEERRAQAFGFLKVARPADAYQEIDLVPGLRSELDGQRFSVNRFGMRDTDSISLAKPPRTTRIAVVGSSIVMGYGVADDEVFTQIMQRRLNDEQSAASRRYEVLNFGVGQQWAIHRLVRIQRKVVGFEPDALWYVAHQDEFRELADHTTKLMEQRLTLPSPQLEEVTTRAGVSPDMAAGEIRSRLEPYETALLQAVYESIVEECRRRGIVPVWIWLPVPGDVADDPADQLTALARSAGFVVCDLSNWTRSREPDSLFRSTDEYHPNAEGHAMIAAALMDIIRSNPEVLPPR